MKSRHISNRSGAFLIEMILSILFFALASAVCIRLFAAAHTQSVRSRDLAMAAEAAQTAAETFKAGGDASALAQTLGGEADGETIELTLDESGRPCADGAYRLLLTLTDANPQAAHITVSKADSGGEEILFRLTAERQK